MIEHDYILQYHLYVLALHRQLAWRRPAYDYDRDMGEVFYLFLRGLSSSHPMGTGVYRDRPPAALIEALSSLMAGGAGAGGAVMGGAGEAETGMDGGTR
jgi:exodeoxyribonuclease V beta subunit